MVTLETKFFTVRNNGNHGKQVGLDCLCSMATNLFTLGNYGNHVVYFGQKRPKGVAGFGYKESMDIF
jgi:hypothetical protein